jgi:aminopeptidase N
MTFEDTTSSSGTASINKAAHAMHRETRQGAPRTGDKIMPNIFRKGACAIALLAAAGAATPLMAQSKDAKSKEPTNVNAPHRVRQAHAPTREDILLGSYGQYRANNDLLRYALKIRVDPQKETVSGVNTITFRMLEDGSRIQLDLVPVLKVDKIAMGSQDLKYTREARAVFIDFPHPLKKGQIYSIDFHYSGTPVSKGRFGGFTFGKDPSGQPWIYTACEGRGASVWWPNKDQARDEVEGMTISVEAPNGLMDVSNGRFVDKKDLGDGYTQWNWAVHYPINNYDVALNIGHYTHFSDRYGNLSLDYYVLPENLAKAKVQFKQVKGMLEAFQHYFGEYPFQKDGYKLVEVPYLGMEHQTAVAYGNHYQNGYLGRDWANVGISLKFDFIIIHESGHEWFGNSVTAADGSDMWIQEGWTTYMEALYVEHRWGHDAAIRYLNGIKPKARNKNPIVVQRGVKAGPLDEDDYFKGALFINTLRSVVNDDARWFKLIHDFYQHFKYRNIMTEDVVAYFNQNTGMNLTPVFNEYLRHADLPVLDLKFNAGEGTVSYRWKADEPGFAMPVRVGTKSHWQVIHPTGDWKTMKTSLDKNDFSVATDLYYVNVEKE